MVVKYSLKDYNQTKQEEIIMDFKKTNLEVITLKDLMVPLYGNISAAARLLGVNRGTMRKYCYGKEQCYIIKHGDGYKFLTEIQSNRGNHK